MKYDGIKIERDRDTKTLRLSSWADDEERVVTKTKPMFFGDSALYYYERRRGFKKAREEIVTVYMGEIDKLIAQLEKDRKTVLSFLEQEESK